MDWPARILLPLLLLLLIDRSRGANCRRQRDNGQLIRAQFKVCLTWTELRDRRGAAAAAAHSESTLSRQPSENNISCEHAHYRPRSSLPFELELHQALCVAVKLREQRFREFSSARLQPSSIRPKKSFSLINSIWLLPQKDEYKK